MEEDLHVSSALLTGALGPGPEPRRGRMCLVPLGRGRQAVPCAALSIALHERSYGCVARGPCVQARAG